MREEGEGTRAKEKLRKRKREGGQNSHPDMFGYKGGSTFQSRQRLAKQIQEKFVGIK